jgi:hypothetical protein
MIFLLRPRQTWMPYVLPRDRSQQDAYNKQLQTAYDSTRTLPPSASSTAAQPFTTARDRIADLKDLAKLHDAGSLTDEEFTAAKMRVLQPESGE